MDGKEKNSFSQTSYSDWIYQCNRETFLFQEPRIQGEDVLSFTSQEWQEIPVPFERGFVLQRLSRGGTGRVMGRIGFLGAST